MEDQNTILAGAAEDNGSNPEATKGKENPGEAEKVEEESGKNPKGKEERTFTQEELNKIIDKRLARNKSQLEELETKTKEFEAREKAITERENRIECKEYLLEKGYNKGLIDIIDTSDIKAFKEKAAALDDMMREEAAKAAPKKNAPPMRSDEPIDKSGQGWDAEKKRPKYYK